MKLGRRGYGTKEDSEDVTGRRKSALFPNTCEFDNKLAESFRRRTVTYPGPVVPWESTLRVNYEQQEREKYFSLLAHRVLLVKEK